MMLTHIPTPRTTCSASRQLALRSGEVSSSARFVLPRSLGAPVPVASGRLLSSVVCRASDIEKLDINKLASLIATQPMDEEQKFKMEALATALKVPVSQVKAMAYKKRGLMNMEPHEVAAKLTKISSIVEVTEEQAREMVVIQPGLLFDTDKQAEALKFGLRAICYELNAEKAEVVDLILKNPSVLHGREMHLSVADMAHLAILREPKGRIVD